MRSTPTTASAEFRGALGRFASRGVDKFSGLQVARYPGHVPLYVLTTLASSPGLALTELDKALAYTGVKVTYDHLAGLSAAGRLGNPSQSMAPGTPETASTAIVLRYEKP
jgi:hypothetical protein